MTDHDCLKTRHADHGCVECDAEQRRGATMTPEDRSFLTNLVEFHMRGMAEISGWGSHRVNAMLSDLRRLSEQPGPPRVSEEDIEREATTVAKELLVGSDFLRIASGKHAGNGWDFLALRTHVENAMRRLVAAQPPRDMQSLAERVVMRCRDKGIVMVDMGGHQIPTDSAISAVRDVLSEQPEPPRDMQALAERVVDALMSKTTYIDERDSIAILSPSKEVVTRWSRAGAIDTVRRVLEEGR